ncbi:MAG TPA: SMC-Scp complex subunit ScpB [Drouetiella sp.]|jgi:segregation and condensation protein B
MLKSKVEAILFLTDKPMRAQAIARIVNEDVQVVRQAILDLIHDYEERASGLEIADDNGYIIQVKDEYASIIDEFVPMEMPVALIRTLSAIAIKQPVPQSEIIKIRGAGAYDHIKELMTRELIIKKEEGRSPTLSTTKKFQEYFRLSHDAKSLRTQLRKEERVLTKDADGTEGGDGMGASGGTGYTGNGTAATGGTGYTGNGTGATGGTGYTGNGNGANDGEGVAPNLHPESIELGQAKQLEVLFDTSPDSTLVFRPEDLDGTLPPAGADQDDDITVMVDDIGGGDLSSTRFPQDGAREADDIPSINVSVSPDLSSNVESAAAARRKSDSTSSGSTETTDKSAESNSSPE